MHRGGVLAARHPNTHLGALFVIIVVAAAGAAVVFTST